MNLSRDYFKPFDEIYRAVTGRMQDRAARLQVFNEKAWLEEIIRDFQRERDLWPDSQPLDLYRIQCARLRLRVVRLVASAFLHVSYDLPRVLATHWPAQGAWSAGPLEYRAEWLYFDLRSIFSDILSTGVRRFNVSGIYAPILWCIPLNLINILTHWISNLREAAWRHGRTLALQNAAARAATEQRMIEAMSLALRDASNLPWRFTLPEPPHLLPQLAVIPAFLADFDAFAVIVLAVAFMLSCAVAYMFWASMKAEEISRFVDEFGFRVERYVNLAIEDPEKFAEMKGGSSDRGFSVSI